MSRRAKIFFALVATALLGLGLTRLRLDVDVLNLLPDDLPAVRGLKLYQQNFSTARELIITLQGGDAETTEAAAHSLAEMLRGKPGLVREVSWQPPFSENPAQSAELIAHLWLNQPPEIFRAFAGRLAPTNLPTLLQSARAQLATSMSPQDIALLSYDPFGFTRLPETLRNSAPSFTQGGEFFASADGTFRLIFIEANGDVTNYRRATKWLSDVKAIVSKWNDSNDAGKIQIHYTGGPAFVSEISGNMQREIQWSVIGTAIFIAGLFWLAHRRLKPMLWLLTLLAVILLATLAVGGLLFHSISIVSLGFAAILLGLAVDYGVVHYQEALAQPALTIPQVRRRIGPGIFWAAATTISAFLVLNFGGLPGLGQLGSLVAVGVGLSALTMIFFFLPPLFPGRMERGCPQPQHSPPNHALRLGTAALRIPLAATALLALFAVAVLWNGIPKIDPSADPLRPQGIPAYAAMEEIKHRLNQKREPFWLIVSAENESQMAERLDRANAVLASASSNHVIGEFLLPTQLWPRPENQRQNRAAAAALLARRDEFRSAALANGFSETSVGLANGILDTWAQATSSTQTFWPTNDASRWIFNKVVARTDNSLSSPKGGEGRGEEAIGSLIQNPSPQPSPRSGGEREKNQQQSRGQQFLVAGFVYPNPDVSNSQLLAATTGFPTGVSLSGWELLGPAVFQRVQSRMWLVLLPMVALVLISLSAAFRKATEILLGIGAMALSGSLLLAVMKLAGWEWNLMNLMALPLVLGTGVDYGIFMQLALRRHNGDLREAHQAVGRALLLCGATAAAGFGSLSWSSNAGMASLGKVCAVGIAGNMLIAVYLLPKWWKAVVGKAESRKQKAETGLAPSGLSTINHQPSTLYSTTLWRFALAVTRLLPESILRGFAGFLASIYWSLAGARRAIVINNLLPVLNHDRAAATKCGRELLQNFAQKLVDLWRYESGLPIADLIGEPAHWELLQKAIAQKRGVLIVTPHLGNWEFGSPMLTERGIPLLVVSLVEPSRGLTELRAAARAGQGVETLVIGNDPFAAVEIIRRLEAGAVVALLVDRPIGSSATTVELFGKPFQASLAAAEFARASGCVLLPACMLQVKDGYAPAFLPIVEYQRPELRDPAARQRLTQQIMRAFEPCIRQHLNQWYHFVPVWK